MTPRQGALVGFVALVELALSNHANIVGTNGLRAPLITLIQSVSGGGK